MFSSISYGQQGEYGMDCEKPSIDAQAGKTTTFNFSCKNTTDVTFGSYQIFPDNDVITPGATVGVEGNTCQETVVAPGEVCAITGSITAAEVGVYTVDFNDEYGGERHYGIFCNNPEKECIEAEVTTGSYTVGQYVESEGGVVFYVDSAGGDTLIVALNDAENINLIWCSENHDVNTSTALYTGFDNTIKMADHDNNPPGSPAADACISYTDMNHKDWYVPSLNELSTLYSSLSDVNPTLSNYGTEMPTSNLITYWSSSQVNTTKAWTVYFFNGTSYQSAKSNLSLVRCIRAI
jgi:hypothetical protein